jgi:hypothetical protein
MPILPKQISIREALDDLNGGTQLQLSILLSRPKKGDIIQLASTE